MEHTYEIKNVDTVYSQAANGYTIEVEIEVFEGEESVGTRKFGYPTDTTEEFIRADLDKVCATLTSDKVQAEATAELEKQLENANTIKESLMSK